MQTNKEKEAKEEEKRVCVQNPHLESLKDDYLFHLNLGTQTHNFPQMFGDVKFVCVGDSPTRMKVFTEYIAVELGMEAPSGHYRNICAETDCFVMYKVGPILCLSHGMGVPSVTIMMHELIKLLHYAHSTDVSCIRIGTSGGIGIAPGDVIVTRRAVNASFEPKFEQIILGENVVRSTELDAELTEELMDCSKDITQFKTVLGDTMCTMDFYEGQARLDGAFCYYTQEEKEQYLLKAQNEGVCNIEMETTGFAAMCKLSGIRAAIVCVSFLDRLKEDQITNCREVLLEYQDHPQILVSKLIKKKLHSTPRRSLKKKSKKKTAQT